MTEDAENLILRLLREIRGDLNGSCEVQHTHTAKLGTLERRMVDVQESIALAGGFAVSTRNHYKTTAERIDRLTETVSDLKARVEALESRT